MIRALLALVALAGCLAPGWAQPHVTVEPLDAETLARALAHREPPPDVGAIPDDATRTPSGLAYKVLQPGAGDYSPRPNDGVTVHFSGWTASGILLESTRQNDRPRSIQVNQVAAGMSEALQLMTRGTRLRVWIPRDLADYGGRLPDDMLCYEVELLDIRPAPPTPAHVAAAPHDAVRAESGWAYEVLREGSGTRHPGPRDSVLLHYTIWTPQGVILDSTEGRREPETVEIPDLSQGVSEAVRQMVSGEKRRLWIPDVLEEFEEGDTVWELQLLAIFNRPQAPPDVAAVPPDATRTSTGLAYRVLSPGRGARHPAEGDTVVVTYSVWTPDGKLVDSTWESGKPVGVPLDDRMPPGWGEAISQMVVGEKRRIWIPEELGFSGRNTPAGMLVFEVDLLAIEPAAE